MSQNTLFVNPINPVNHYSQNPLDKMQIMKDINDSKYYPDTRDTETLDTEFRYRGSNTIKLYI